MTEKILLGYEMQTGTPVEAKLHHLFISGVTQHSGKTTSLEAFINRAGMKALVFRTGRGEIGFTNAHPIQPYFRERTDWRFVEGLLSVHLREKTKIYRSDIITATRGARDLATVHQRIRQRMRHARGFAEKILIELDQYFSEVIPTLGQVKFADKLELQNGLNLVDLEGQPVALQQLVISSSLEYIMENMTGVIVVVPEAYKLIPLDRPSPVRLAAETITREGMKIKNFLWLDSQQLTGLDLDILRNVDIWLFGRQTLDREKERAAKMIPGHSVTSDNMHELELGQFYLIQYGEKVQKIYVQPAWMSPDNAKRVAKGEIDIDVVDTPLLHIKVSPELTSPADMEQLRQQFASKTTPPVEISTAPDGEPIMLRMARENAEGKLSGTDPMTRMANLMADQQKRIDEAHQDLAKFAGYMGQQAKLTDEKITRLEKAIDTVMRLSPIDPPTTTVSNSPVQIVIGDPAQLIEVSENLESLKVDTNGLRGQIAKTILEGNIPSQLFNATRLRTILISSFGNKAEQWDVDSILNELKSLSAPPYRLFTFDSKHRLFRLKSQAKDRVKE